MRKLLLFSLIFILLSPCFHVEAQVQDDYIIDGNRVYIDDENVYINVSPHTTSGGWVYLNFTSKVYSGEVDFAFGFDSDSSKPKKMQLYNPKTVDLIENYTIPPEYFEDENKKCNWTYTNQDQNWFYEGVMFLWNYIENYTSPEQEEYVEYTGWVKVFEKQYVRARKSTRTIFWVEKHYTKWDEITHKLDWNIINHNYDGLDRWYISKNMNILQNVNYYVRIYVSVPPSLSGNVSKFGLGFKPSSETLQQAIQNNHFYYLDPWMDNNWEYRKSHVLNQTSDADTNYQVDFDVNYGSGTDSGNSVYLDSKSQTDFDDVRWTDDDETTELDYWREEYTDSGDATFWVEISDNLSAGDVTIYLYYGNNGASTTSSGEDTFLFFDDFNDGSVDTSKWDIHSGGGGGVDETGGNLRIIGSNAWNTNGVTSDNAHTSSSAIRLRFKTDDYAPVGGECDHMGGLDVNAALDQANMDIGWYWGTSGNNFNTRTEGGSSKYDDLVSDTWYISEVAYDGTNATYFLDNVEKTSESASPSANVYVQLQEYRSGRGYDYWDWLLIRKYVSPEPAHHTWGSEEVKPASPVNSSCSITNMDDGILYGEYRTYLIDYDGSDANDDILIIQVNITQDTTVHTSFQYNVTANAFTILTGSTNARLYQDNCSATLTGNNYNLTFGFRIEHEAEEDGNLELKAYAEDSETLSDEDTFQTNYAEIETEIVNYPDSTDLSDYSTRGFALTSMIILAFFCIPLILILIRR